MKIALFADVHLANHKAFGGEVQAGVNRRCRQTLAVLKDACKAPGVDAVIVAGDVFDSPRPEPQVIAAAASAMRGLPTWVLVGNHEQASFAPGDHAVGPLGALENCRVVDVPQCGMPDVLMVPFRSGAVADWLPSLLEEHWGGPKKSRVQGGGRSRRSPPASSPRALVLHAGISDEKTPQWCRGARDSIGVKALCDLAIKYGIAVVFAGHWHEPRAWSFHQVEEKRTIHLAQLGALVPTGWDNPGEQYGLVTQWDTERNAIVQIGLPGPRFMTMPFADVSVAALGELHSKGHEVYLRLACSPEDAGAAERFLKGVCEEGVVVAGELAVETVDAQVAARTAAVLARSAETFAEALSKFVQEMPLVEGVDRAEVLERAQRYLEG